MAQIFGKPIYVITDVALLPLSSQQEAEKGMTAASSHRDSADSESDSDDDAHSAVDETHDANSVADTLETASLPEDVGTDPSGSRTSIAEDVFARRGQYGKFASQWLSKKGWGIPGMGAAAGTTKATQPASKPSKPQSPATEQVAASDTPALPQPEQASDKQTEEVTGSVPKDSTLPLLHKLLRSTRLILSSRSFYFAYDFDITKRLGDPSTLQVKPMAPEDVDPLVCHHLLHCFETLGR